MRALGTIQAEGLRAAGELIERMLRSEPDGRVPPARSAAEGYTALVDAWTELLRRTVDGLARPGPPVATTVPVDAGAVGPPVRLALPASGGDARPSAEVWLHNGTSSAVGPLVVRCGPLTDAAGTVLDGADVRFEPGEPTILPPRSSRAVVVSLTVTGALRPGTYRGTIQAQGAPRLWLPFEVVVEPC